MISKLLNIAVWLLGAAALTVITVGFLIGVSRAGW